MRRHCCQSVCDQLHSIAHSYPSTLSSIIYCYYSAHGVQKYKKDAKIGDLVDEDEVDFTEFDRADVNLAKNVMKQSPFSIFNFQFSIFN